MGVGLLAEYYISYDDADR